MVQDENESQNVYVCRVVWHGLNSKGVMDCPGWQRMALQILYFVPFNLMQPAASFAAVSQKLLVSPVLKKLVFSNAPDEVCKCRGTLWDV